MKHPVPRMTIKLSAAFFFTSNRVHTAIFSSHKSSPIVLQLSDEISRQTRIVQRVLTSPATCNTH